MALYVYVYTSMYYERTIPTERPPFVGEFSANFCRLSCIVASCCTRLTFINIKYRGGKPPEDGCMKPKHVV
jgi:hypothetical protein